MMRWQIKNQAPADCVEKLQHELNIPKAIAELLAQRGIIDFESSKYFFRPELKDLHNPFLMQDMQKAVDRLVTALSKQEKILIYGDYDVDGTTSVALMMYVLKNYSPNLDFYIPDRYAEGYGISFQGIDYAKKEGFSLIIALDCGIKSADKIAYANGLGVDFIICDHHLPGEELPNAVAVLDAKRADCKYPYKELSGCGVGFKLLQALFQAQGWQEDTLYEALDYCAVSICCDIVPITGENRILAYYGLKQFNEKPKLGFATLKKVSSQGNNEYSVSDVVFKIGPRINAAGRIESAKNAVKLLLADNVATAETWSKNLHLNNMSRREKDEDITFEAMEMIDTCPIKQNSASTIVYQGHWHKGVIGIVASRLVEKYYRPTLVFTNSQDKIAGSARSVKDFDIHWAIEQCSDLLETFGGHKYAAGLTLKPHNFEPFCERFERVVGENLAQELRIPELEIDTTLDLAKLIDTQASSQNQYPKFFRLLNQMAPFGPENMNPVFLSERVKIENPQVLAEKHLRFSVCVGKERLKAIAFNMADKIQLLEESPSVKLAYQLEANDWQGVKRLQLQIKGIES